MTKTSRELISRLWNDAWKDGLWAASWSKSLDGLTAGQAAWHPPNAPGVSGERHSIWQNVLHMCLWREHWLRKLSGGTTAKDVLERENFPPITDHSESAWSAAKSRFLESQTRLAAALTDAMTSDEQFEAITHFLPHDCYHFGQINLIRGMLGLMPVE